MPGMETVGLVSTSGAFASANDADLIRRIAARDHDAFETLYRRYARQLLAFGLRRLGDRSHAEEAMQETFAKVWRAASTYRPERGPGGAWLYGIARHTITDQARRRRYTVGEPPDLPSDEPGPAELAESDSVNRRVHRALAVLPARQRELIQLAYWSGLTQAEIADRLGIPLGTVKTRTRRALLRLAQLLEEHEVR